MATFLRQGLTNKPSITEVSLAIQQTEEQEPREVIETTSLAETRDAHRDGKCVLVDLSEVEGRTPRRQRFDDEEPKPQRRRKHRKSNIARMMRQQGPSKLKGQFG